MVLPINRDIELLKLKASPATKEDLSTAQNLADTLTYHLNHCVGMAANMIGVSKAIIAIRAGHEVLVMLNPKIVKVSRKMYQTEEGCLSLEGERKVTRYESIEVSWQDMTGKKRRQKFTGLEAEAIQHEVDHLNGIII